MSMLRRHGSQVLLLAVLALLPFGHAAELPLLIAALIGLVRRIRHRGQAGDTRSENLLLLVFLAYWLPELLSAFDSLAPAKSWQEVGLDLRFLPFGWFAIDTLATASARRVFAQGAAVLIALWTLDALVQAATGSGLGGAMRLDRLSGIFGDDNLKLGPVLAVLAPLLLVPAWRRFGPTGLATAWALLGVVVLLAGARAGWIGFALVSLGLLWHLAPSPRRLLAWTAAALILGTVLVAASYQLSERFAQRVEQTRLAFDGDLQALDLALSYRLGVWHAATRMACAHWINGVGVRAFRHAYAEFADPDDRWVAVGASASHAHQIVLEVASETGLIGVLAWLVGSLAMLVYWLRLAPAQRAAALAPALAVLAMVFPLNTHLAFYSAFWGLLFWWLLAVLIALSAPLREQP
ncbi:MAG: O-antigen ligase family protein [Porticoccaceae bacterium]